MLYAMESGCLSNCETSRCFTAAPVRGTWKPVERLDQPQVHAWTLSSLLIEHGLRLSIGKGDRSPEAEKLIRESGSLYLVCVGGAAAYLSQHIVSCETFLWPDLGAEAVYRLVVKDFPAYVSIV
jgi:hypothetical protein